MMKKIILAGCIAFLCIINAQAQKSAAFEGKIVYDINFDGSGLPPEALQMMKGAEVITYMTKDQRRVDINMPIQSTSAIMDEKSKSITTLMDIMGQKYMIKQSAEEWKKEEEKMPETSIKYTTETKTIAGYLCKKAEVTTISKEGKEETMNVYYTEEIPAATLKQAYKGLKGFPLEYSMKQGGVSMKFIAKSISKETVPASMFELPKEGYKETTMEEFQKEMAGFGQ
jgi:GLPGLI family protein